MPSEGRVVLKIQSEGYEELIQQIAQLEEKLKSLEKSSGSYGGFGTGPSSPPGGETSFSSSSRHPSQQSWTTQSSSGGGSGIPGGGGVGGAGEGQVFTITAQQVIVYGQVVTLGSSGSALPGGLQPAPVNNIVLPTFSSGIGNASFEEAESTLPPIQRRRRRSSPSGMPTEEESYFHVSYGTTIPYPQLSFFPSPFHPSGLLPPFGGVHYGVEPNIPPIPSFQPYGALFPPYPQLALPSPSTPAPYPQLALPPPPSQGQDLMVRPPYQIPFGPSISLPAAQPELGAAIPMPPIPRLLLPPGPGQNLMVLPQNQMYEEEVQAQPQALPGEEEDFIGPPTPTGQQKFQSRWSQFKSNFRNSLHLSAQIGLGSWMGRPWSWLSTKLLSGEFDRQRQIRLAGYAYTGYLAANMVNRVITPFRNVALMYASNQVVSPEDVQGQMIQENILPGELTGTGAGAIIGGLAGAPFGLAPEFAMAGAAFLGPAVGNILGATDAVAAAKLNSQKQLRMTLMSVAAMQGINPNAWTSLEAGMQMGTPSTGEFLRSTMIPYASTFGSLYNGMDNQAMIQNLYKFRRGGAAETYSSDLTNYYNIVKSDPAYLGDQLAASLKGTSGELSESSASAIALIAASTGHLNTMQVAQTAATRMGNEKASSATSKLQAIQDQYMTFRNLASEKPISRAEFNEGIVKNEANDLWKHAIGVMYPGSIWNLPKAWLQFEGSAILPYTGPTYDEYDASIKRDIAEGKAGAAHAQPLISKYEQEQQDARADAQSEKTRAKQGTDMLKQYDKSVSKDVIYGAQFQAAAATSEMYTKMGYGIQGAEILGKAIPSLQGVVKQLALQLSLTEQTAAGLKPGDPDYLKSQQSVSLAEAALVGAQKEVQLTYLEQIRQKYTMRSAIASAEQLTGQSNLQGAFELGVPYSANPSYYNVNYAETMKGYKSEESALTRQYNSAIALGEGPGVTEPIIAQKEKVKQQAVDFAVNTLKAIGESISSAGISAASMGSSLFKSLSSLGALPGSLVSEAHRLEREGIERDKLGKIQTYEMALANYGPDSNVTTTALAALKSLEYEQRALPSQQAGENFQLISAYLTASGSLYSSKSQLALATNIPNAPFLPGSQETITNIGKQISAEQQYYQSQVAAKAGPIVLESIKAQIVQSQAQQAQAETAAFDAPLPTEIQEGLLTSGFQASILTQVPGAYGNERGALQNNMAEQKRAGEYLTTRRAGMIAKGQWSPTRQLDYKQKMFDLSKSWYSSFMQLSQGWQSRLISQTMGTPGTFSLVASHFAYADAVRAGVKNPQFGSTANDLPMYLREAMETPSMLGATGTPEEFNATALSGVHPNMDFSLPYGAPGAGYSGGIHHNVNVNLTVHLTLPDGHVLTGKTGSESRAPTGGNNTTQGLHANNTDYFIKMINGFIQS